tara:strand:- start:4572 stop:4694 length:123 start_codon:yes stop_codon:yes gene_type:complete
MKSSIIKNIETQIEKATDPKIKDALKQKLKVLKSNKIILK